MHANKYSCVATLLASSGVSVPSKLGVQYYSEVLVAFWAAHPHTLKELFDRVNFNDILSFLRDIHLYSSIQAFLLYCSSCVFFHTITLNTVPFSTFNGIIWH